MVETSAFRSEINDRRTLIYKQMSSCVRRNHSAPVSTLGKTLAVSFSYKYYAPFRIFDSYLCPVNVDTI